MNTLKSVDGFKAAIKAYLLQRGKDDVLFQAKLKNPKKKLTDCITYILNQVKASGRQGFADDEIYNLAVHYYDEEDINPGSPLNCDIRINHQIELTEEEKEEAKKEAKERLIKEQMDSIKGTKKKKSSGEIKMSNEQTLF